MHASMNSLKDELIDGSIGKSIHALTNKTLFGNCNASCVGRLLHSRVSIHFTVEPGTMPPKRKRSATSLSVGDAEGAVAAKVTKVEIQKNCLNAELQNELAMYDQAIAATWQLT